MELRTPLLIAAAFALISCRHAVEMPAPGGMIGERFPAVRGTGLDGREWTIPDDMAGRPALLLVGYLQRAQFDCDRWLVGLLQAETPVAVYELPTIEGMAPRVLSGVIDGGMRQGIPEEDWGSVITVYGDAGEITTLLGRSNPQNAQVVLLDAGGTIRWFHNRGFSAGVLLEMDRLARALGAQ